MKLELSESALADVTNYHRLCCLHKNISQARIPRSGSHLGGILDECLPSGLQSAIFLLCLHMVERGLASSLATSL